MRNINEISKIVDNSIFRNELMNYSNNYEIEIIEMNELMYLQFNEEYLEYLNNIIEI